MAHQALDPGDPVSIETLQSLARTVLRILRGLGAAEKVPEVDRQLAAVVDDLEPRTLRKLLEVSLPAMAIEGHHELAESIQHALRPAPPAR